jgi:hypothetical protein
MKFGALKDIQGKAPEESMQLASNRPIAAFSGGRYDDVKIFKVGDGYYGDTGDFDFTAKDVEELMEKLKTIGATTLNFGEIK